MELQVKKRDESVEPWSFDKLVTAIGKTGIPIKEAEQIASSVQSWAMANAANGTIDSTQIRDKVIEELKGAYPAEASNFETYKKE